LSAIFAILEYFPQSTFPEAGTVALTLVAILLPLSSIWAAATPDGPSPIFRSDPSNHHSKLGSYSTGHTLDGSRSRFGSHVGTERKGSVISPSTVATTVELAPHRPIRKHSGSEGLNDMDLDDIVDFEPMSGVRVDRSYSVHSGTGTGGAGRD
jgi:pheromone alpha factor receptor